MSDNSLSACCFQRKSSLDVTSTSLPWYVTTTKNITRNMIIWADSGIDILKEKYKRSGGVILQIFTNLRVLILLDDSALKSVLANDKYENSVDKYDDSRQGSLYKIIKLQG